MMSFCMHEKFSCHPHCTSSLGWLCSHTVRVLLMPSYYNKQYFHLHLLLLRWYLLRDQSGESRKFDITIFIILLQWSMWKPPLCKTSQQNIHKNKNQLLYHHHPRTQRQILGILAFIKTWMRHLGLGDSHRIKNITFAGKSSWNSCKGKHIKVNIISCFTGVFVLSYKLKDIITVVKVKTPSVTDCILKGWTGLSNWTLHNFVFMYVPRGQCWDVGSTPATTGVHLGSTMEIYRCRVNSSAFWQDVR